MPHCTLEKAQQLPQSDPGRALRESSSLLSVAKLYEKEMEGEQGSVITIFKEAELFRNALTSEIVAKIDVIEVSIAASGSFTDLDFARNLQSGETQLLTNLNYILIPRFSE